SRPNSVGDGTGTPLGPPVKPTIIALTPEQHALGDMASAILPLPADPQQARYALLLLVDLLNDTLIA
ncbi:hypothetical protein ACTXP6_18405, partial [Klebsiella pneumoniae]